MYAIEKNLTFAINLVNFLASKLIQHAITIGSIKYLDTGSFFPINLVNFLASKFIQHVISSYWVNMHDKKLFVFKQSLKEIHSFTPSINVQRANLRCTHVCGPLHLCIGSWEKETKYSNVTVVVLNGCASWISSWKKETVEMWTLWLQM